MKWFEGSIPAAIQDSQSRKVVFVVYISGDDEQSKHMDETWTSEQVVEAASEHNLVALKLQANSQSCAQFSAIYPVVVIPCTFFISNRGTPLEIIGGHLPPAQFLQKIEKAVQLHKEQVEGSTFQKPTPESSSSPQQEQPTATQAADGTTEEPEAKKARESKLQERVDKAKDVLASSASQTAADGATSLSPAPADIEDRVERAKALIAQKKEEKARKEAEEEKQKELERRKVSQSLSQLRAYKDEMEAKEVKEQLKKDREADRLARQRVKEQIARDRAERAARFQKEKDEREKAAETAKQQKLAEKEESERQAAAERSKYARIQFRLPDGSFLTNQFEATDTLDTARQYLTQEVGDCLSAFRMTTTYPRREFTEEHMKQTLQELQLAPSAAIVVLPGATKHVTRRPPGGGGGDSFLMMLLGPLIAIWNFIYNFLFASPPQQPSQQQPRPVQTASESSTVQASTSPSRPKTATGGLRQRKEGNIHRLSNMDQDDDQATWNGNSTQQM